MTKSVKNSAKHIDVNRRKYTPGCSVVATIIVHGPSPLQTLHGQSLNKSYVKQLLTASHLVFYTKTPSAQRYEGPSFIRNARCCSSVMAETVLESLRPRAARMLALFDFLPPWIRRQDDVKKTVMYKGAANLQLWKRQNSFYNKDNHLESLPLAASQNESHKQAPDWV
jgi:hypothetical protein